MTSWNAVVVPGVQLWDCRMETLLNHFDEHQCAVRDMDFHKTRPRLRVWSPGGDGNNTEELQILKFRISFL